MVGEFINIKRIFKNKLAVNTAWLFFEKVFRLVLSFLLTVLIARHLGAENLGIYSLALSYIVIISSILSLGLDEIVVKKLVDSKCGKHNDEVITSFVIIKGGLTLASLLVMVCIAQLIQSDLALYVAIMIVGLIFKVSSIIELYYISRTEGKVVSLCLLISNILSSLFKLYLLYVGYELFWFVFAYTFELLLMAVFILVYFFKNEKFRYHFSTRTIRELIDKGWPLMLSGVIISLYMKLDQLMIGYIMTSKDVGIYAAAAKLSEVWYFIPVVVMSSLFPTLIRYYETNLSLFKVKMHQIFVSFAFLSISLSLVITYFADGLISVAYGADFNEAGEVLSVHVWASVFIFFNIIYGKWIVIENLQKSKIRLDLLSVIINVLLNIFLIPPYGVAGAAYATLLCYPLSLLLICIFDCRFRKGVELIVLGKYKENN